MLRGLSMAGIGDGRPSLVPASGQNRSHKAWGLKGLALRFRSRLCELDSNKGTEKLTH